MASGSVSALGVGSGLELQSILDQLREVDEQLITRKKDAVTELTQQLDKFTVVKNKLLEMKSSALTLSLSSTFLGRTVTSSDETVLTATAADGTTAQSATVSVGRLASQSTFISAGVSATDASVNTQGSDQAFVFKLGSGSNVTITVPDGTTLTQLATLINESEDNPGVTATVINDGSAIDPYKLVLQTEGTGRDNEISISAQLPDLAMAVQGESGDNLNAELTVNGILYQRQSNTVSDVLTGVNLELKGVGSSSVAVSNADTDLTDVIKGFVTAYNDTVQEIKANTGYDQETEKFGLLARTTMRDLPYTLQNMMTRTITADSAGKVKTMFDLGLEFNRDGTISIDEETLSAAVTDNRSSVEAFFLGDAEEDIEGFADYVNETLRGLTGGTGLVEAEKTAAQTRIDSLELQIESETERLNKRYDMLTRQFVDLDSYMNKMTSLSDYLSSQFDSLGKLLSGSKD
ncbi:flagellar filament capping protein FliD [Thiovibrio sp. JS02]